MQKLRAICKKTIWDAKNEMLCIAGMQKTNRTDPLLCKMMETFNEQRKQSFSFIQKKDWIKVHSAFQTSKDWSLSICD